jgi:hypothetical protein
MITFGICLIYYGIALFLYQLYGWLSVGVWIPFPVRRAWEGFFGSPHPSSAPIDALVNWLLAWPLGLALLIAGLSILTLVFVTKRVLQLRRDKVRRKWILEQCAAVGYRPWALPRVLRELDDRILSENLARQEEVR